jgi:ureidoacrylate peracid hydrolase
MVDPENPIAVAARPAPVTLVPANTAVIVVDMQNDFATQGGMFALAGIDISAIRAAIPPTKHVLTAARTGGCKVVYLKMAFRPNLSDAVPSSPTWRKHLPLNAGKATCAPDGTPSRILVRDTWNTDIVDELPPEAHDTVVYKHRYSGFFETDLHDILHEAGVTTLVFAGATTSVCVDSTVRDAMFRDYDCLLLEDCMAEPIGAGLPWTNHQASLQVVEILFGSTTDSAAFLHAISGGA